MKIKIVTLIFLCSSVAVAREGGGSVTGGDGGHGVVCDGGSTQILDMFEARDTFASRWPQPVFSNGFNRRRICKIISERKKSVRRLLLPDGFYDAFDQACSTRVLSLSPSLPNSGDSGALHVQLPNGCRLVQLALHTRNRFPKIFVNSQFINQLSDQDIAALLLHERFHDVLVDLPTTEALRQLIGYIFADREFQKRNTKEILSLLEDGELPRFH